MQIYIQDTFAITAYFIKDNHCAIVEDSGPDVNGKESGIIAPYGLCTLWNPNEEETR